MRTFVQKPKAAQQITPAKSATLGRALLSRSQAVNSISHVQRMIGNQAVQQLLRFRPPHAPSSVGSAPPVAANEDGGPAPAHVTQEVPSPLQMSPTDPALAPQETESEILPDLKMLRREAWQTAEGWFPPTGSIQRKCSACAAEEEEVQPKLPVSQPGDVLEQEADRFAEKVMRGHTPPPSRRAAPAVQRDVLDEAIEQAEEIDDDKESLPQGAGTGMALAKREGRSPLALPERAIPGGGGRPLDPEVRHFMLERTGLDFAHVRVHADADAAASASRLAARAYTVRSHIYFGRGEYEPKSREGRSLLAHELAHVVQQGQGQLRPRLRVGLGGISAAPPSILRSPYPLAPPGNCIQGFHDELQRQVKRWCDHPSGRACTSGESCGRLLQKIRRNQMCARNRRAINDTCYGGGDFGHLIAEGDARRAQATCMALFRAQCTPRRGRAPVQIPATAPAPAPQSNRSFLDHMSELTGLTGAALIVYLIISEGTRLFPPRNLVPVP